MRELALTTDPDELEVLAAHNVHPVDDQDEHDVETRLLYQALYHAQRQCKPHHCEWARDWLNGRTVPQIAADAGKHPQTVRKALQSPKIDDFMQALAKIQHIQRGPSLEARNAMLWRIAKREEEDNPRVSIQAIDVLNKATGTYIQENGAEGGVTVLLQQFNFGVDGVPHGDKIQQAAAQDASDAIDADFTPVTIDTEATPTDD